jgi:hypothetical protein
MLAVAAPGASAQTVSETPGDAPTASPPPEGTVAVQPPIAALTPAASPAATAPKLTLVVFDQDIVLVGGRNFRPNEGIKIDAATAELGGSAHVSAGKDGRFLLGFQVPADFSGKVSVTARQGQLSAAGTLTVNGSSASPTPAPSTPKPSAPAAPRTGLDTRGKLSGLPWMSGVHPSNELEPYLAFGQWRGRPIDLALVFTIRDGGWSQLQEPRWPVDIFKPFQGTLVISQPMYPEGQGNNADCARGAYDGNWKAFGSFLVNNGRADSIVRIGWEFNGDFMYWHTDADPSSFKECFQKVAAAIRSTDPQAKIDWTFNAHGSPVPSTGTPWAAYPGDQYVDFVSIDSYDHFPPSKDEATWNQQCNDPNGMCYAMKFAREHGKKVGVGEWGVASCSGNGGGDNPFYIKKMYETFMANQDVMGYESYYHDPSPNNVCSTIMGGGQNPQSSAEYKKLFGAA